MEKYTHEMRRQYWTKVIQECNTSGMRKKEWMEQNGIRSKSFYYWQKKLRLELSVEVAQKNLGFSQQEPNRQLSNAPVFMPVQTAQDSSAPVVIRYGSALIEISENVSDSFLRRILEAAGNA